MGRENKSMTETEKQQHLLWLRSAANYLVEIMEDETTTPEERKNLSETRKILHKRFKSIKG